jgi:predicted negative regulator of RcsB-dependent stress response
MAVRADASRPWPSMLTTKGDVALRMKDFEAALQHFTKALALASPDNRELMVSLLNRRAVALLYLRVRGFCGGSVIVAF